MGKICDNRGEFLKQKFFPNSTKTLKLRLKYTQNTKEKAECLLGESLERNESPQLWKLTPNLQVTRCLEFYHGLK